MAVCAAENRKLFHELNVEKVLVNLLSVADASVKTATCKAVHAMSLHRGSKDSFRDLGTCTFTQPPGDQHIHTPQWSVTVLGLCVSGGIPTVVQLLSSESFALREAATEALSSLTHGNQLNAL